jgi:hypothetical protein
MPVLTPAGELPSLNDPANFNPRAIAALNWLVGLVAEIEGLSASDWFDVMQGLTDATAGRVMTTGAFGLGGSGVSGSTPHMSDLDSHETKTGFYRADPLTVGTKPGGSSNYGFVTVQRQAVTGIVQTWTNSNGLLVATRAATGGVWGDWIVRYDRKNIIGSVFDIAGVPAGAIIEEGSNGNGQYVKFADGHQICTHKVGGLDVNVGFGSLYRTDVQVWTYPAAFIGAPVVYPNGGNNTSAWGGGANVNSVSANAILVSVATLTNTEMLLMAIGRWK